MAEASPPTQARPRRALRRLFRPGRMPIAVLTAALLIGVVGAWWPRKSSGVPEPYFHPMKLEWRHQADVVITGDSRSEGGVSPEAMREILGPLRILNFAFSNNGWSPQYLEAIEPVLDPEAKRKVILVGLTPGGLTPILQTAGYLDADRPFLVKWRWKVFGRFLDFFDPLQPWAVIDVLRGHGDRGFYRTSHPNGWQPTELVPPKMDTTLRRLTTEYAGQKVDLAVLDRLLAQVRRWRERGIEVYGFRTPTSREVAELELDAMGLDLDAAVAGFRAAGGVWIELPPRDWRTYDGSHLLPTEAVELSKLVAAAMAKTATAGVVRP